MWLQIKTWWTQFENWVASWLPGLKTKITVALGFLGNTAYVLKDYISGLPIGEYFNTTNLLILNMVLFTLAYWFRGLGDRED